MARLYVGNLNPSITKQKLADTFLDFGPIVEIWYNPESCYAFIEYEIPGDAHKAIRQLNKRRIFGVEMRVELTKYKRKEGRFGNEAGRQGGSYDEHLMVFDRNPPQHEQDRPYNQRNQQTVNYGRNRAYSPRRDYSPPPQRDFDPPRRGFSPPQQRGYSPPRCLPSPPRGRDYSPPPQRGFNLNSRRGFSSPQRRALSPPNQRRFSPPQRRFSPPQRRFSPPNSRRFSPPAQRGYSPPQNRGRGSQAPLYHSPPRIDNNSPEPEIRAPSPPIEIDLSKPLTIRSNSSAPKPSPTLPIYKNIAGNKSVPLRQHPIRQPPQTQRQPPRAPPMRTRITDYRDNKRNSFRSRSPPPYNSRPVNSRSRSPQSYRTGPPPNRRSPQNIRLINRNKNLMSPPQFNKRTTPPIRITDYRENRTQIIRNNSVGSYNPRRR